ncbi:MAG: hypothetical protein PHX38_00150 [Sulfuricella sp.]|nr:hypothetical protein [Sulfuricella sp.]
MSVSLSPSPLPQAGEGDEVTLRELHAKPAVCDDARAIAHGASASAPSPWFGALPPSLLALIAQVIAALLIMMVLVPALAFLGVDLGLVPGVFAQGGLAVAIGIRLGLASWWLPINLLFVPALAGTLSFGLSPAWFLAAFLALFLAYWSVFRSQVPLYLSSRKAWAAVAELLPVEPGFSLLDVGAGLGGMLGYLSMRRPDGRFHGMEIAPLPFALAWLRKWVGQGRYQIGWGDFWKHSLADHDIVYAYLSPVPMARLWAKACGEMAPGSRFISNTFSVPGIEPEHIVELVDFHRSRLYVYRVPTARLTGAAS